MTIEDYLQTDETLVHRELQRGILREPPAPFYDHQRAVVRATVLLDDHVRREALGVVCVSPMDVVLDRKRAIVVQPDVMVILNNRRGIINRQIWGAPNLVVEIASASSRLYDGSLKRRWYGEYGVDEYWLIDPVPRTVQVIRYGAPIRRARTFRGRSPMVSTVLPRFKAPVAAFFE